MTSPCPARSLTIVFMHSVTVLILLSQMLTPCLSFYCLYCRAHDTQVRAIITLRAILCLMLVPEWMLSYVICVYGSNIMLEQHDSWSHTSCSLHDLLCLKLLMDQMVCKYIWNPVLSSRCGWGDMTHSI